MTTDAVLCAILLELHRIRSELERRSCPRDSDDLRVLRALLTTNVATTRFSSADVVDYARVEPDPALLREALELADCQDPMSLGRLFGRVEGHVINGMVLARLGRDKRGVVWCIRCTFINTPDET